MDLPAKPPEFLEDEGGATMARMKLEVVELGGFEDLMPAALSIICADFVAGLARR